MFYVISIVVLCLIAFAVLYKSESISVKPVFAGSSMSTHSILQRRDFTISPFEVFYHKGKKVNPKNYIVRVVDGCCMEKRGIVDGNVVFVHEFKNNDEKKQLSKGSILYIEYKDENRNNILTLKLRELSEFNDDYELAETVYYKNGFEKTPSSKPHKLENIIGVVEMCFPI